MHLEHDPSCTWEVPLIWCSFMCLEPALDEFADENDGCRRDTSPRPWQGGSPVESWHYCFLPILERLEFSSELYVDHLVFAAQAYIARTYGG